MVCAASPPPPFGFAVAFAAAASTARCTASITSCGALLAQLVPSSRSTAAGSASWKAASPAPREHRLARPLLRLRVVLSCAQELGHTVQPLCT